MSNEAEDLPLFTPVTRLVRADDPSTSKAAAIEGQDRAASDHALILKALNHFAHYGATAKQIADYTGLTSVQVSRRIHELRPHRVTSFDDRRDSMGNLIPGHEAPAIVESGCAVHVLVEHRAACRAVRRKSA